MLQMGAWFSSVITVKLSSKLVLCSTHHAMCLVSEPNWCTAGKYSEHAFPALDYILDEASKHGVRLLLTLVNNWDNADSKTQVQTKMIMHPRHATCPCAHAGTGSFGAWQPMTQHRSSSSHALCLIREHAVHLYVSLCILIFRPYFLHMVLYRLRMSHDPFCLCPAADDLLCMSCTWHMNC